MPPRTAANSIETRREKTRLAPQDMENIRQHHQYARTVVTTLDSSQQIHVASESGPLARNGSNGQSQSPAEPAKPLASHFLHCWANKQWATETLPSPLCSSCALQYHGVLVLQNCEASHNSHAKKINFCESRRISMYISHRVAEETPCRSYVSQPLQTCSPSSLLSFPGAKSGTCGQNATQLNCSFASPAECHEKVPRTGPVGCPP
jgi:hypothetical protein